MVLKSLFFCNSSLIISKILVNIRSPSAIFSSITRSNNRCSYYYFFSKLEPYTQIAKPFTTIKPKPLNPILLSKLQLQPCTTFFILKSKPFSVLILDGLRAFSFHHSLHHHSCLLHVLLQTNYFSRAACVFDKFTMQFEMIMNTLDAFCDLDSTNPSVVYGF
uniref:Uncharacterized protein n=1 Tax=Salix viminalis TaxID=40686 RepID=A0A6N2LQ53_SALVM